MNILAIECSAKAASAAVARDGEILCEIYEENGKTHSETLMPAVMTALKNCSLSINDIDLFAVSEGPGSFTGIRIGLAAIKGMAFPDKKVVPLSTLEVIARAFADRQSEGEFTLCAVMDARCGQFYNADFKVKNGEITRLCPDRAEKGEIIASELKTFDNVVVAGDGAAVFCEKFGFENSDCTQRASAVAVLGYQNADKAQDAATVFGKYLRRPQAERERLAKLSGESAK
ncbi:MAG: tRNA (adenosine(37)-N6)-threonylcarbamoyltransferase complex dimerization subunit type 1 TsaB [Oscillospiraceae bacterium]|nr:tRNA (adenosine(37)-N6)-threonylcarbamoyltransferase complex dimerization subunit type 1 TsaB [Candidatus Equicaccousia limihippi]